jgi:phosphate transport system protein
MKEDDRMTTHLEALLQQDLERIRLKVVEMGGLAESAIRASIRAVLEKDRQLAFAVILRDQYIDQAEKQLDKLCLQFLVRYQPAASLLRLAYATIKVNLELERVGDYAESIARQALKLTDVDAPLPFDRLQQVGNLAVPMLHDAVEAFVRQDADLARKTIEGDEAVDLLRDTLTKDLTLSYKEGRLPFAALTPLITVARRLERVSDQARNIGMETLYMCTGELAKHPGLMSSGSSSWTSTTPAAASSRRRRHRTQRANFVFSVRASPGADHRRRSAHGVARPT